MKMEFFENNFNAGHWRTLQAICTCSQIFNWSTWCLEIPPIVKYKHYQISSGARASSENQTSSSSDLPSHANINTPSSVPDAPSIDTPELSSGYSYSKTRKKRVTGASQSTYCLLKIIIQYTMVCYLARARAVARVVHAQIEFA